MTNKQQHEFRIDWNSVMISVDATDKEKAKDLAAHKIIANLKKYSPTGFNLVEINNISDL